MTSLFIGSKLKIKRANHHIDALNQILITFLKSDFYRLAIDKDPKDGAYILNFQTTKELPWEVPLIIGDTVHNLYSALDLMVYEIVILANDIPNKRTEFLIRNSRNELLTAINDGKIKAAPKAIIDLIVDTIKPYRGGDDALCALYDLDITDKHHLLIPVIMVTELNDVVVFNDAEVKIMSIGKLTIGANGKFNIIKASRNMQVTYNGQPTFGVFFRNGQPFEGNPIIPTLHQLSQLVSGILQTIEKAYIAIGKV